MMLHPVAPPWYRLQGHGQHGTEGDQEVRGSSTPSMCCVVRGGRACVCQGVTGHGKCPMLPRVRRGQGGGEGKGPRGTHPLPRPLTPLPQDQTPFLSPPSLPFPHPSPFHTLPPFLHPSRSQTHPPCPLSASCSSPNQPPPSTQPPSIGNTRPSPHSPPTPPSDPSTPSSSSPPVPTSLHPLPSTTISIQSPSPSPSTTPPLSKVPAAASPFQPLRTTDGNQNEWRGKSQPRRVKGEGESRGTVRRGTVLTSTKSFTQWFPKVVLLLFPLLSTAVASYKLKRKY